MWSRQTHPMISSRLQHKPKGAKGRAKQKPKSRARPRTRAKAKQKGTPYVTVLPCPRLRASWLVAGTELIIGTICAAPGRCTFHSQKKAAKGLTGPIKPPKIISSPVASDLNRHLRRAEGAAAVVAPVAAVSPARAGSARRRRRIMGLRTMANTNTLPSGTRATRGRRTGVRARRARHNDIPIFGIPMGPSSSRWKRPSLGCTSRRCRSTRPTSPLRSGRRKGTGTAGGRTSRSKSTSGAPTGTCPSTTFPRRRRTTLRVC